MSAFLQRDQGSSTAIRSPLTVNRYSSTFISSSSSAASSTADYLCLHPFCEYRCERPSDLERHTTIHFPPPSSKNFDRPALGCGRVGDLGFRREDELNKLVKNVHHNNILRRESAAMLSKKRRASPAEEDAPGKRSRCDREVMSPDISEFVDETLEVSWL